MTANLLLVLLKDFAFLTVAVLLTVLFFVVTMLSYRGTLSVPNELVLFITLVEE